MVPTVSMDILWSYQHNSKEGVLKSLQKVFQTVRGLHLPKQQEISLLN